MADNWKYASMNDRERLGRIRDGDTDVYNAEKQRNKELRKLQSELGLSTTAIDKWDAAIDNAFAKSANTSTSSSKNRVPKFQSPKVSAFNKYLEQLSSERKQELSDAKKNAQKSHDYLEEWLANNGFSSQGKTSKEEKRELDYELAKLIYNINKEYEAKEEKAKSDFLKSYLQ